MSCSKFRSPEDRRNRVTSLGLCLLCLRKGHVASDCLNLSRHRCDNSSCQYKDHIHNIALCGSPSSHSLVNDRAQSFKTSVTHKKVSHNKNKKYDSRVSTNTNFDNRNNQ